MKENRRVMLTGRAHHDAEQMLLQSSAGCGAQYIAHADGTVCTPNRHIVGMLPERIAPVEKRRGKHAPFVLYGYREKNTREVRG